MKKMKVNNINIKKIMIVLFDLGLAFSLSACANSNEKAHSAKENGMSFSITNNKYNNSSVMDNNLSELFEAFYQDSPEFQEKLGDIYPDISSFLNEYGQYFDSKEIMGALYDLKFAEKDQEINGEYTLAEYNFDSNTISFSPRLSNKKASQIKETKMHEFIHFLFQNNFSRSANNFGHHGISIDEGIAALLVRELGLYDNTDIYEKDHYYVRVLLELIGVDHYMQAAGRHDYSQLKKYLSEYGSSKDADHLIEFMDQAVLKYKAKGSEYDEKAWDIISKMYQNKHGVSIDESDDNVIKCYSNKLLGTTYNITGADYYCDATSCKNYFMNKCNYIQLHNSYKGDYGVVFLDDENMVQNNSSQISK